MTPAQLQEEIIHASRIIYSFKHLLRAIFAWRGLERMLFIGEYFWQKSVRRRLKSELPYLRSRTAPSARPAQKDDKTEPAFLQAPAAGNFSL
jgi:hypothetical protein